MIWFPFYASDFIGATVGLSCLERAIYALMLPLYYEAGPFPADKVRVYRIVGCESDEQKRAVDYLLETYFVLRADGWYQPRAEREKAKDAARRGMARELANKRWHSQDSDAKAMPRHSQGTATAMQPTPTPTPIATEKDLELPDGNSSSSSSAADALDLATETVAKAAYVVPDCPYDEIVRSYHEILPMLPRVEVVSPARKRTMQARWRQICADDRLDRPAGLAWVRTFFEHVRESRFLTGRTPPREGRKPFVATLDFIMHPEKFVAIYEGRYHR